MEYGKVVGLKRRVNMGILWFITKIPIKIIITPLMPVVHFFLTGPIDQLGGQSHSLLSEIISLWKW